MALARSPKPGDESRHNHIVSAIEGRIVSNCVHSRAHPPTLVHARLLDIRWTPSAESMLSHCNHWRSLGDSNPCFRRERALFAALRPALAMASGGHQGQPEVGKRWVGLGAATHMLFGSRGPMGASAVVVRDLHLATVVRLKPYRRARLPVVSFDAWSSARTRGVVRALP
jgi:hypothetical protein